MKKNINIISSDLFNKIRSRFSHVTLGDDEGKVVMDPEKARFFEFTLKKHDNSYGAVTIYITEDKLTIIYFGDIVKDQPEVVKHDWYHFLRSMRKFAKRNLLEFDVRNILKSNLDKRDYKFLALKKDNDMGITESKMFGTTKSSYQKLGDAKIIIRHSRAINPEMVSERSRNIKNIFIENSIGERFHYPYKYLRGARAMATHISNGGSGYDDFGKYIIEMNEELYKLRNFKRYMNTNSDLALQEDISNVANKVYERIDSIINEFYNISKSYTTCVENSRTRAEINEEGFDNWVNTHPIGKYREDLENVIPYIYRLVNVGKTVTYEDLKKNRKQVKESKSKTIDHIAILDEKLSKLL